MKEIKINAKSAPVINQLVAREKAGFKNIEIQLIHEFVSDAEYEATTLAIQSMRMDISVVHTPLIEYSTQNIIDISLNLLTENKNYDIFENTCQYAEYIAKLENHRINVVVHNDFSKDLWMKTKLLEEKIIPKMKKTLDQNPMVDLLIENASSYGDSQARFNTIRDMEDTAYATEVLNHTLGDRAKPMMDTCHMIMNWEAWKKTSHSAENFSNWDMEFQRAVQYSPLGLIHLNNMRENGLGENHGVAFDCNRPEDIQVLKEIMNAYEKYANCEITIEVREKDYEGNLEQLILTKDALEKLGYTLRTK